MSQIVYKHFCDVNQTKPNLQDAAVDRAAGTVQQCKDYFTAAKDASFEQVGSILNTATAAAGNDGTAAQAAAATANDVEDQQEEEQLCSIEQAVDNIERNRWNTAGSTTPFSGFPTDMDDDDEEVVFAAGGGGGASRQVTTM
jgi:hypothetical protein